MRSIGGSRKDEREDIDDQFEREDWMIVGKSEQGTEISQTAGVDMYMHWTSWAGWLY